jgi:hypothetical protein
MSKYLEQFFQLVLITVSGLAGSVIVGLLSYGNNVFNTTSVGFAFVSFGLSGAFIFAFYHVRGLSDTITAAVIASALQFGVGATWVPVMNAAIWSFGVNLPVVALAFLFERKLSVMRQWKFVVVGLVYGAMFVLLTLFVGTLAGVATMPAEVFRKNFLDGLLMGTGLGVGVEAAEAFLHSLESHRLARRKA